MMAAMLLAAKPSYAAGTTFVVNSTADTEDATPEGVCNSCTLREAIQEANANNDPGQVDRIDFHIPGTGVKTITPFLALPAITEPVVVNGYSQPGVGISGDANGNIGIDLGFAGPVTNDAGDPDNGPNDLQNKPSLGSARTVSGKTTIKGTLSSRHGASYTIQFFSNPAGTGQGKTFIGQKTGLAVDGSGKGSFTFSPTTKVAAGRTITTTATNEFTGDTSEFSGTRTVTSS